MTSRSRNGYCNHVNIDCNCEVPEPPEPDENYYLDEADRSARMNYEGDQDR